MSYADRSIIVSHVSLVGLTSHFSTLMNWKVTYFKFYYTYYGVYTATAASLGVRSSVELGHSLSSQPRTETAHRVRHDRGRYSNQSTEFSMLIAGLVFPSLWTEPVELLGWHVTAVGSKTAAGAEGRGMKAAGALGMEPVRGSGDTLAGTAYYTDRMRKDYSPWAWACGNTWWKENKQKNGLVNHTLENETCNNYSKPRFFRKVIFLYFSL